MFDLNAALSGTKWLGYDFDCEKEFNLTEESNYHYVDGEEGDRYVKGYFKDGKLFGVAINNAGDDLDSTLTEFGKNCVVEYIRSNLHKIIESAMRGCVTNEIEYKELNEELNAYKLIEE